MSTEEKNTTELSSLGLTDLEHAGWNLFFNMREAGIDPKGGEWWEQEWLAMKRLLEEKGLNTDPSNIKL